MKPIDYRNETWSQVMERVNDKRNDVHLLLSIHGPCTCRELAEKSARDILSIAPRVTELYQMGLVELVGKSGTRGIYKAVDFQVAEQTFETRRSAALVQPELNLKEA